MRSGEFTTVARLAARFREGSAAGVLLGIGDDAAVLAPVSGREIVWTVDAQVEGTHFTRRLASWEDVGWRSFMAAASDLAAMGADPWCALAALVLDVDFEDDDLDQLARGQQAAAELVRANIVGGNLARGQEVSVTTTLLGHCERAITRHGARAGDGIWIAGWVGLAAAGFTALDRMVLDARVDPAVAAWLRPSARIEDGRRMATIAHAAIDVSDGLAQDLGHLATASGLRAILDERSLREHAEASGLVGACAALEADTLGFMLHGGEDYALVVASPEPIPGFWCAGILRDGEGVALAALDGTERELAPGSGFDHFG